MFSTRGQPRWLVRVLTGAMTALGRGRDFVWGMAARDPLHMAFADQIVTSDAARFQRTQDFLAQHPDLRLAGPTWGWVAAAIVPSPALPRLCRHITTPVLICGAGHDRMCCHQPDRTLRRRACRTPSIARSTAPNTKS